MSQPAPEWLIAEVRRAKRGTGAEMVAQTSDLLDRLHLPTVCDTQDVISETIERRLALSPVSGLTRLLEERVLLRVKKLEPRILNSYTQLICVTERDVQTLKFKMGVETPAVAIATLRDREKITYENRKDLPGTILFFGALHNPINKDAATFAAIHLFPEIRRVCPNATLTIAGSNAGAEVECLRSLDGVTVVHDLSTTALTELIHNARVVLLPLRMGAGIKGRVIEAMEAGTPVVGTSIAAEGIPVRHGKEMIITDDPHELVRATCQILENDVLRNIISQNARSFVETEYSWKRSYGRVHECIDTAITTHNARKLSTRKL